MLADLRLRLRALFRRGVVEDEIANELAFHVDQRIAQLIASGVRRDEASRIARVEFGGVAQVTEEYRRSLGLDPLLDFGRDLARALRRLAASPLFTLFAIASLAVGLAMTTTAYSIVESLLFRNLGVREPERVAFVVTPFEGRLVQGVMTDRDFEEVRASQRSFATLSASASISVAVEIASLSESLPAEGVDGTYFSTLGVGALRGRVLDENDDHQRANVVVISRELWRSGFGESSQILGRVLRVAGHPMTIVGVAADGFSGVANGIGGTRLWVPLSTAAALPDLGAPDTASHEQRHLLVMGRLRSDDASAAAAELGSIAARLDRERPVDPRRPSLRSRQWLAKTITRLYDDDAVLRRTGLILVGMVGLVLVVACTNLANLVLSRGVARHRETAIRSALGAGRARLVREQFLESALLAIAGAAVAYATFVWLGGLLQTSIRFPLPNGQPWLVTIRPALSPPALAVAASALCVSLVVFGLEPAFQLTRTIDVLGALQSGAGLGVPRPRRQRLLIRWQVAVATGFFIVASLLVRFVIVSMRHDPGVELQRLAVATLRLDTQPWSPPAAEGAVSQLMEEIGRNPAVDGVAVATALPFGTAGAQQVPMSLGAGSDVTRPVTRIMVGPSFFSTLGIRLLHGRAFADGEHNAAVISATTARALFGTTEAVGRHLVANDASPPAVYDVVGVAADTDVGWMYREGQPLVYVALPATFNRRLTIAVRAGDATVALRTLRQALARNPSISVDALDVASAVLTGPFRLLRAMAMGAAVLGAVTLVLALCGLYGLQSQLVTLRRGEIGLRVALGATGSRIRRMIVLEGFRPVLEGLVLGTFGGIVARAGVNAYLDLGLSVVDPWMLLVAPVPVVVAAYLACQLPARAAAAVDPNTALRHA